MNPAGTTAFAQWIELLGPDRVDQSQGTIRDYGRSTLPRGTPPLGVLFPTTVEDVQGVVRIANAAGVGLYPISRGKNWGYGDACPVGEGQVIVDLSLMDRIVEVDSKLAYAVIEAGVTQEQLVSYLNQNCPDLMLDCTGSGPEASIVGNTLERGFGHTPYGDHFLYSCGMEVVLGDGRMIRTGFGHYQNAKAAHCFKWGIGPYLDGLFTQSNLGIVTKMGVWLMPRPERVQMFYLTVSHERDLKRVVETLRPLRMQGILKSIVHIGNDLRVLSSFQPYPWERASGTTPLPEDLRRALQTENKIGAWNVSGAIYGTSSQLRVARRLIRKNTRSLGKIHFAGSKMVSLASKLGNWIEKLGKGTSLLVKIRSLEKVFGLLNGSPTDAFMQGSLWRAGPQQEGFSLDPLKSQAGLIWLSPILPCTGEAADELMGIVVPIFRAYTFEPLITVSLITERAMVSVISISFDKRDPVESARAQSCYQDAFDALMQAGYIPYRSNIHSMDKLAAGSETFWDVIKQLKQVLDPGHVLAPGRYEPGGRST